MANKLTSSATMSAMDYQYLPLCNEHPVSAVSQGSSWNIAVSALHGDAFRHVNALKIPVGQDLYCATACDFDVQDTANSSGWKDAIARDFSYNVWLDGLPASYRFEDE